jgi:hypothetical protein
MIRITYFAFEGKTVQISSDPNGILQTGCESQKSTLTSMTHAWHPPPPHSHPLHLRSFWVLFLIRKYNLHNIWPSHKPQIMIYQEILTQLLCILVNLFRSTLQSYFISRYHSIQGQTMSKILLRVLKTIHLSLRPAHSNSLLFQEAMNLSSTEYSIF